MSQFLLAFSLTGILSMFGLLVWARRRVRQDEPLALTGVLIVVFLILLGALLVSFASGEP